jgi:hypothetical protein
LKFSEIIICENWIIVLQVLDELLYPYWGFVWFKETDVIVTEEIANVFAISIPV